eukprot:15436273-Alexandrium_andersonii.AAC.1
MARYDIPDFMYPKNKFTDGVATGCLENQRAFLAQMDELSQGKCHCGRVQSSDNLKLLRSAADFVQMVIWWRGLQKLYSSIDAQIPVSVFGGGGPAKILIWRRSL